MFCSYLLLSVRPWVCTNNPCVYVFAGVYMFFFHFCICIHICTNIYLYAYRVCTHGFACMRMPVFTFVYAQYGCTVLLCVHACVYAYVCVFGGSYQSRDESTLHGDLQAAPASLRELNESQAILICAARRQPRRRKKLYKKSPKI